MMYQKIILNGHLINWKSKNFIKSASLYWHLKNDILAKKYKMAFFALQTKQRYL